MKRFFTLLLTFALVLSLAACGGKTDNTVDQPEDETVITPSDEPEKEPEKDPEEDPEKQPEEEPEQDPETETPSLNQYCEDFLASLGEGNAPAMMDVTGDLIEIAYPDILSYDHNQLVLKIAAISSVPYEFAIIDLKNDEDIPAIEELFQERIKNQVEGGAYYPETIAGWEKAQIVKHGNVVALICANEDQEAAVDAFFEAMPNG